MFAKRLQEQLFDLEEFPDDEKGQLLFDIGWDYIAITKNWQIETVKPLWEVAMRSHNPGATYCVSQLTRLKSDEFFFNCIQLIFKKHAGHLDALTSLMGILQDLPVHYKEAREQFLRFLEKSDLDQTMIQQREDRLNKLKALAASNEQQEARLKQDVRPLQNTKLENILHTHFAEDFSDDENAAHDSNKLIDALLDEIKVQFKSATETQHADFDSTIETILAVCNDLRATFQESQKLIRLQANLNAYLQALPVVTDVPEPVPVPEPVSEPSFLSNHWLVVLIAIGIGLAFLIAVAATGGFFALSIAALPFIIEAAAVVTGWIALLTTTFTITPIVLTSVFIGAAALFAGFFGTGLTLGIKALCDRLIGKPASAMVNEVDPERSDAAKRPQLVSASTSATMMKALTMIKLDTGEMVRTQDVKSIRLQISSCTQADLKELHASCQRSEDLEFKSLVSFYNTHGLFAAFNANRPKGLSIQAEASIIRASLVSIDDEIVCRPM